MRITLTQAYIDAALKRVEPGLRKYMWLQQHRDTCDLRSDPEFRKRFNGFYPQWTGQIPQFVGGPNPAFFR
jgi:hypothetical protein